MRAREWSLLVLLAILWGGSFFFAKVAVAELQPLTVVFGRVALAALALNLVLVATGRSLFRSGTPGTSYAAMGVLNNLVPFGLIFWGQTQIASGLAAILNATTPLFTLVVAHFLTDDERIGWRKVVALLLGLCGVATLVGPGALTASSGTWGQIACLGAALSYAFAGVYGRRFATMGVSPIEAAAGQLTASAVLILPIMLAVDRPWLLGVPTSTVWAAMAGLALLSTALAYILYFRILQAAGSTNLLLVTLLIPAAAVPLGAVFLDEEMKTEQLAGMGLIGAALVLIDGRLTGILRPAK
ncbi:MAG: DMT family transporter [Reyranella sp.]|nr:MAG: DMT family transporter [Reyranella sp.]